MICLFYFFILNLKKNDETTKKIIPPSFFFILLSLNILSQNEDLQKFVKSNTNIKVAFVN